MALDPNQDRRTQIVTMLETCDDFLSRLTSWEKSFLESVTAQFEEHGKLSDAQVTKLEQIYVRLP